MIMRSFKKRFHGLFHVSLCMLLLVGCSDEAEYKAVNFSKTVSDLGTLPTEEDQKPLRVAVAAMTSPKENFTAYQNLFGYMEAKLGKTIRLVQRKTYAEINRLFASGELDIAFICTGPYVTGKERYGFEGLVVPVIKGKTSYQAYLIVNKDSRYQSLEDLRGHIFAFTDPDSNTGASVPRFWLSTIHETPESFFKEIIYTYSHDNSIKAVAQSLVDGATVDGAIWDYYSRRNPAYTNHTRVIRKSKPFGAPPLVATTHLPQQMKEQIITILTHMDADPQGKSILDKLTLDGFREIDKADYRSAKKMFHALNRLKK